ncbi:hypothetical protein BDZ90DRAFT_272580, partial [Jaminaea rosea]
MSITAGSRKMALNPICTSADMCFASTLDIIFPSPTSPSTELPSSLQYVKIAPGVSRPRGAYLLRQQPSSQRGRARGLWSSIRYVTSVAPSALPPQPSPAHPTSPSPRKQQSDNAARMSDAPYPDIVVRAVATGSTVYFTNEDLIFHRTSWPLRPYCDFTTYGCFPRGQADVAPLPAAVQSVRVESGPLLPQGGYLIRQLVPTLWMLYQPHQDVAAAASVAQQQPASSARAQSASSGPSHKATQQQQQQQQQQRGAEEDASPKRRKIDGGSSRDDDKRNDDHGDEHNDTLGFKPLMSISVDEAPGTYNPRHYSKIIKIGRNGFCGYNAVLYGLGRARNAKELKVLCEELLKLASAYWFSGAMQPVVAERYSCVVSCLDLNKGPKSSSSALPVRFEQIYPAMGLLYDDTEGAEHYDAVDLVEPLAPPRGIHWDKMGKVSCDSEEHGDLHVACSFETRMQPGDACLGPDGCHCLARQGWVDPEPPVDLTKDSVEEPAQSTKSGTASSKEGESSSGVALKKEEGPLSSARYRIGSAHSGKKKGKRSKNDHDDGDDDDAQAYRPQPLVSIDLEEPPSLYNARHYKSIVKIDRNGFCGYHAVFYGLGRKRTPSSVQKLCKELSDFISVPANRALFPLYDDKAWSDMRTRPTVPHNHAPDAALISSFWFSGAMQPVVAERYSCIVSCLDRNKGPRGSCSYLPTSLRDGQLFPLVGLLYDDEPSAEHYDAFECDEEDPGALASPRSRHWDKLGHKFCASEEHRGIHEMHSFETRVQAGDPDMEQACHCLLRKGWKDPEGVIALSDSESSSAQAKAQARTSSIAPKTSGQGGFSAPVSAKAKASRT